MRVSDLVADCQIVLSALMSMAMELKLQNYPSKNMLKMRAEVDCHVQLVYPFAMHYYYIKNQSVGAF